MASYRYHLYPKNLRS
uniref:ZmAO-1 n=1 Tax=Arundo donax TaxID=35708 RepID=A0A0A9EUB5_ARUDO